MYATDGHWCRLGAIPIGRLVSHGVRFRSRLRSSRKRRGTERTVDRGVPSDFRIHVLLRAFGSEVSLGSACQTRGLPRHTARYPKKRCGSGAARPGQWMISKAHRRSGAGTQAHRDGIVRTPLKLRNCAGSAAQRRTERSSHSPCTVPANTSAHGYTTKREREKAPIAADLKGVLRGKSWRGEETFALAADVSEAHRQVPIHDRDWHLRCCEVLLGGESTVESFGIAPTSIFCSLFGVSPWASLPVLMMESGRAHGYSWWRTTFASRRMENGTVRHFFFVLCAIAVVPSRAKTSRGDLVT